MNLKFESEVKRLGLISGFYDLKNIVDWAEDLIAQEDEISEYGIFDVVAGINWPVNQMSLELKNISGASFQYEQVKATLFSLFLEEAKNSNFGARKIASCLANLGAIIEGSPELTSFKDQYDDLDAGIYGCESEIRAEVIGFLKAAFTE